MRGIRGAIAGISVVTLLYVLHYGVHIFGMVK